MNSRVTHKLLWIGTILVYVWEWKYLPILKFIKWHHNR